MEEHECDRIVALWSIMYPSDNDYESREYQTTVYAVQYSWHHNHCLKGRLCSNVQLTLRVS